MMRIKIQGQEQLEFARKWTEADKVGKVNLVLTESAKSTTGANWGVVVQLLEYFPLEQFKKNNNLTF